MHQGFAAGDHGNFGGMVSGNGNNFTDGQLRMGGSIPAVFNVAPHTTHVTSAETDKKSRFALVETFSLKGIKSLHDGEGLNGEIDGIRHLRLKIIQTGGKSIFHQGSNGHRSN